MRDLYKAGQVDESIEAAQDLLEDGDLPRYHRIKTLIFLATAIEGWDDIEECRLEAENLWAMARRWSPEGRDFKNDQAFDELRTALDVVKTDQQQEAAEDYALEMEDEERRGEAEAESDLMDEDDESAMEDPTELAKAEAWAEGAPQKQAVDEEEAGLAEALRERPVLQAP